MPPLQPEVHLHTVHDNIDQWHQQHYGVPFITPKDEEEDFVDDGGGVFGLVAAPPGDPRPSSHAPPLAYQGPSTLAPPPADDPPQESSFADELTEHLFPSYPPSSFGGPLPLGGW